MDEGTIGLLDFGTRGLFGLWDYRTKDKGLLDERLKGKSDPYSYKQIKDEKNKDDIRYPLSFRPLSFILQSFVLPS